MNQSGPLLVAGTALSFEALGRIFDSNLGAIVSIIDLDTRLMYVNERFAKSFDKTPTELVGKTLLEIYDTSHSSRFMPYIKRVFAGETVTYERMGPVAGSTGVWHTVAVTPLRDVQNNIIGAVSSSMRVHELKVTVEALRVANERLSSHIDNSPLTVIEMDAELCIVNCSSQIYDLLGIGHRGLVGKPLLDVLSGSSQIRPLSDALDRLHAGLETRNRVETALTHVDGNTVYSEWFNSALTDASGKVSSMMALVHNTTARTLAEARLQQVANHDPLTGLLNRRAFSLRLEQTVQRALRSDRTFALLFVDLDGFKRVNDVYGHAAGDDVLCEVARRLGVVTRQTDVVARLGGDEFVILAETGVTLDAATGLCNRLLEMLVPPCIFNGGEAQIGASVGIAMCPRAAIDAIELLRLADAAMYEAKRTGKGRYFVAERFSAAG
jgi:diguanylate cyclase (GGDEF)-like protein/PAS domain S-box-containing protein